MYDLLTYAPIVLCALNLTFLGWVTNKFIQKYSPNGEG